MKAVASERTPLALGAGQRHLPNGFHEGVIADSLIDRDGTCEVGIAPVFSPISGAATD